MTRTPLRVFLSYRREDASGHAGRLYDSLADRFGQENVFMDVDTIGLGSDFAEVIEGSVAQCDVLVALIGRRWLESVDDDGRRRLDDPQDFVRIELETALAGDLVVIPAVVQGATFPDPEALPPGLRRWRDARGSSCATRPGATTSTGWSGGSSGSAPSRARTRSPARRPLSPRGRAAGGAGCSPRSPSSFSPPSRP